MSQQFSGTIDIRDSASNRRRIELAGDHGIISAGGNGKPGAIDLFPDDGDLTKLGTITVVLGGQDATLSMGGNRRSGIILLFPEEGNLGHSDTATVELNGQLANLRMGSNETDGGIVLQDTAGKNRIHLDARLADIHVGGHGRNGNLMIFPASGDNATLAQTTIHLDGNTGDILLRDTAGKNSIRLDAPLADIHLGGNGHNGNLMIYPASGDNATLAQTTIHLDGNTGDIVLRNADCAEDFDVPEGEEIESGTVVVINNEGQLQQSMQAYDKKVAGVISGAGGCRPGIVLDRQHRRNDRLPVALSGKVYCKVDAQYAPVEVGDLLTTSNTPGYAMKAQDPLRAFGAVIGKALQRFDKGTGLIPILVALQ